MVEEIYWELKALGECRSASQFSEEFLGMEKNYLRSLKWHEKAASPRALAHCAAKLRVRADCFGTSHMVALTQRSEKLRQLSEDCVEVLLDSFEVNP
ncbi:MAG: DUF6626 family protein [Fimbriimonadaceae bacterium]